MNSDLSQDFIDWILAYLPVDNKLIEPLHVSPLIGDAGFRRYYRRICRFYLSELANKING